MDKRVYEASLSGSVESLNKLLQEDRLVLARTSVTCFDETPLHIAAMLGHVDFAKALVSHKHDLAGDLDSHGQSPLHLACANGYIEIVKVLLMADHHVCLVPDQDERIPLHLAAMKGRVDIINELVQLRPEATTIKLDRGKTVLHLCVIYNRLEALKLLVELSKINDNWVNVKDDNGNTILHVATTLKHVKTIKYLVGETEVEVNAVNGNGNTALDIIEYMPIRDLKVVEIRELVLQAGGVTTRHTGRHQVRREEDEPSVISRAIKEERHQVVSPSLDATKAKAISRQPSLVNGMLNHLKRQDDWLKKKREALLVAATVITAMAYQSGLNPPGGLWQDNNSKKILAGTSIMADNYPKGYIQFWKANTVSFIASLSVIFLLVSGVPLKKRIFMWILMAAMWVTISAMALTYSYSIQAISPHHARKKIVYVVGTLVLVWMGIIGLVFLGHTYRFIRWIIRKVRKGRNKRNVNEGVHRRHGQVIV